MQAHILEADLLVQSALDSLKSGMEGSFDSGYCTSPVRIAAGMQLTIYVNFYLIKKNPITVYNILIWIVLGSISHKAVSILCD